MLWVREIVNGLIETYETNDVYEICDILNIEIVRDSKKKSPKSYFSRNNLGDEFIFLNESLCVIEEKALIAHEIGHAILHPEINIAYYSSNDFVGKNKLERQADYFAAELLLYDIDFSEYLLGGQTKRDLAHAVNVSEKLLNYIFKY